MIKEFVNAWEKRKGEIEAVFKTRHPENYSDLVKEVVKILPDVCRETLHCIDDGDYQGTLLFLIPEDTYQPDNYYYVKVEYGSCSGCDTLESIRDYDSDTPNDEQVKDYMTLCLHIIQKFKKLGE